MVLGNYGPTVQSNGEFGKEVNKIYRLDEVDGDKCQE